MKHCIVISDSFKGTLSSTEICGIAREKIARFFPECRVTALPVADGGEGTVDCFLEICGGERIEVRTVGPWMEPVTAAYGRMGDTAVVEMAAAAGLPMVGHRMDPSRTSTYGVGLLLRHAVEQGARKVILGLGGSCTNDAGCGCAAALGVRFRRSDGSEFIPTGDTLSQIAAIDTTEAESLLCQTELVAMCDITNPLYGPTGAAYVFAPQKGADKGMVDLLDRELRSFARTVKDHLKVEVDQLPGAGAAGGFGAGCVAFLGAKLQSGIETILEIARFDELLADGDLVITGEGRLDSQSLCGKVISGVASRAKEAGVPVLAIVGEASDDSLGAYDIGVTAVFPINRKTLPFSEARHHSRTYYTRTLEDILRLLSAVRY